MDRYVMDRFRCRDEPEFDRRKVEQRDARTVAPQRDTGDLLSKA
jgi:hypothetical protein